MIKLPTRLHRKIEGKKLIESIHVGIYLDPYMHFTPSDEDLARKMTN
jgi:hypothetical protein